MIIRYARLFEKVTPLLIFANIFHIKTIVRYTVSTGSTISFSLFDKSIMTRIKLGKGTTKLCSVSNTVTRKCNVYGKNELLLDNIKKWNGRRTKMM